MAYNTGVPSLRGSLHSIKALVIDESLSIAGAAADAAATGQLIANAAEKAAEDLQRHVKDTENPHAVTKSQLGLGNVDNTADADKPISTAQAKAIAEAKRAGTDAMNEARKKVAKTNSIATLSADGWSENLQTVEVYGVTKDNTIIVGASPESYISYAEGNVRCSAQSDGTLTFQCDNVPEDALTVNILILD